MQRTPNAAKPTVMFGDMERNIKWRSAADAACAMMRARPLSQGLFLVKAEAIPRHSLAAEPKARGPKSGNRPANPLTCRASDLLCLDANAVECPWFPNQAKKSGDKARKVGRQDLGKMALLGRSRTYQSAASRDRSTGIAVPFTADENSESVMLNGTRNGCLGFRASRGGSSLP